LVNAEYFTNSDHNIEFYRTILRFNDNKAETMTERPTSDIAFTDAAKSAQQRL
tara:strand:- start:304 stop:462 length:159 start_codon:yes stop_codon:yes gene_type:complete